MAIRSFIGPEPSAHAYAIMPSTVRLSPSEILTTIRCREEDKAKGIDDAWIDAYLSKDNGRSWRHLNRPAPHLGEGNPPALVKLRDGRLCLAYGVRRPRSAWRPASAATRDKRGATPSF